MFSNIANYLRGVNSSEAQEEILSVNAEVGPALFEGSSICDYSSVDTEDDWVLVNKSDDSPTPTQGSLECISLRIPMHSAAAVEVRPLHRTPSASSLPSSLEESWFLTPPPCFTSTGPVHMETSSLENLLIEHPSMSVYQQRPPHPLVTLSSSASSPASAPSCLPCPLPFLAPLPPSEDATSPIEIVGCESVAEFDEGDSNSEQELVLSGSLVLMVATSSTGAEGTGMAANREAGTLAVRRQGGGAMTTNTTSSHVESRDHCVLQLRSAQKIQQKRACQGIKRNQLDRSNKARELNSRNKIQRRSDRMLRHSGANNNRKC
ncbi:uncharacterized protein TP53INP [Hetaerina americana]|uniref:uncharacterized protein TP53INP n=1 Tax=Hetaerina americana TaxID=62018 RepID=UPI003A7F6111